MNMEFIKGLGMGMIAGAAVGMAVSMKRRSCGKTTVGRALRTAGDIVEGISGVFN